MIRIPKEGYLLLIREKPLGRKREVFEVSYPRAGYAGQSAANNTRVPYWPDPRVARFSRVIT